MSMTVSGGGGGGVGEHELMVGPVAEALGVSRSWLLERSSHLSETVDLPVSLLVELLNAADCLYDSEPQRNQKIQQWLSRISGRPLSEFDNCMSLLLALRRQFRLTRDEDLSDVTVWRRKEARPVVSKAQVEITIRPDNGSRLKRLAKQLGSPEAAIEFLMQMEEHCGKAGVQKRTRWPPRIHYESTRGQLKVDLGTEMVCVVLSQFKPDSASAGTAAPATASAQAVPSGGATPPAATATAVPAHTGSSRQQTESKFPSARVQPAANTSSVPLVAGVENGSTATSHHSSASSAQQQQQQQPHVHSASSADVPRLPLPVALPTSFQTVELDATLPAQMFADDDCGECAASAVDNNGGGIGGDSVVDSGSEPVTGADGKPVVSADNESAVGSGGDFASNTAAVDSETVAVASGEDKNVPVTTESMTAETPSTTNVIDGAPSDSKPETTEDEMLANDDRSDVQLKPLSDSAVSSAAPETEPAEQNELLTDSSILDTETEAAESSPAKSGLQTVDSEGDAVEVADDVPIEETAKSQPSAGLSADDLETGDVTAGATVDDAVGDEDQQMEPLYIAPSPEEVPNSTTATAAECPTELNRTSPNINTDSMDVDEGTVEADTDMNTPTADVPMESTTDSSRM